MKYVSAKEAKKYFQISGQTLKVWKDTNQKMNIKNQKICLKNNI